ncbi:DegV family EDD domain-containing protein [Streptococcus urinalis FB127-CNA-2]|uniref:EDD domain protein, DegV family n=1 Tax=Streptococcus urinalis 2285-97 TaxID=764291 RepID=G5KFE8_9STRE|nr:DegV family protein [Streptococcus urinalis]EHJ56810.1 hypothetical protein STRUR_0992 [Streptococcus urinalis 2285-97]EKS22049.1 DegV family EDD domain-containing protein [Streptococcus urinalis FB127-CNA-2]VEF31861.1 DegV family protein [Streptococcus urinalis]
MKLAIITDNSAANAEKLAVVEDVFVLDIPVIIENQSYIEGKNLSIDAFYQKMSASDELPKTSQPSLAELNDLLERLTNEGYTHVIGVFIAAGISGFWQNIQFLKDEFKELTIAFPDTRITSKPQTSMVENVVKWYQEGLSFDHILEKLNKQIELTTAFIMVDDLNHLVKGGRLSNGAALLGNLLSIKPILRFNEEGKIVVYEKVRTEKKAIKRLISILEEETADHAYQVSIIHSRAEEKALDLKEKLENAGYQGEIEIVTFGAVIATHLGEGAVAFGITPVID